ncbi:MAG: 30S ribosomal protein S5 alanine N-acetyltransferase [Hyphomicrobiales bacterium]|nr:MAG: 30S ribosomal protein S5 alanine N-acetyltransferase [Hyphomicrobiales bacterium]
MLFLRASSSPGPTIRGEGIYLRPPVLSDYSEWAALRGKSRDFLEQWEPSWPSDDLTRTAYRRRVRRYQHEMRQDGSYAFLLFRQGNDELLGGLSLSFIRRGVAQATSLGYWMGEPYAGQGFMTRAVRAVLPFAFNTLRLHRVEAACLPHNAASIRLLEKVGFMREGYARRYLRIDGKWQDHLLFARLADDHDDVSDAGERR